MRHDLPLCLQMANMVIDYTCTLLCHFQSPTSPFLQALPSISRKHNHIHLEEKAGQGEISWKFDCIADTAAQKLQHYDK